MWFDVDARQLVSACGGGEESVVLPVLTHKGDNAGTSRRRTPARRVFVRRGFGSWVRRSRPCCRCRCRGCSGTPGLDPRGEESLVFTDSVQDAAHRAGFVQARSHALTLRSLVRQAIGDDDIDLAKLAARVVDLAGDDQSKRYRVLPPSSPRGRSSRSSGRRRLGSSAAGAWRGGETVAARHRAGIRFALECRSHA